MAAVNNPYNQYKQTQISTASQGHLIVMLYDGMIKFLNIAIENMNPKSYDVVNTNILKTQDIISELMVSLNTEEGGQIAQNLLSLYVYFKKRLLEANIQKKAEILQEVLKMITELRSSWAEIASKETKNDSYSHQKSSFTVEG
ncbi:MAG TPA: flagellar export chaperone FliS [Spirochaetota bacterium]|nr:flagellar export chaperone FliS [Spirochaetota bacterium]HPY01759.1 flagellar export chaperone FliS [Spirochaetota bacterium]HQA53601.1 flagellar export chaperone FliS [Spirochaetota bacterium]